MFDTSLRPLIDPPLAAGGRLLARMGISAGAVTFLGLVVGLLAALAIANEAYRAALLLVLANRILDGLDGAVARVSTPTDRGGYLDICADYVFYAAVPFAFAVADPGNNALAAAALLAGFCLTCSSFLAFAAIAARRGLDTDQHGKKSFFYSTGLVEGTETILFFLAMILWPGWFSEIALLFALLCVLTAIHRGWIAMSLFR
ncbi:MAG TPA: CDP-alcohol phosphatidyltransferase family protein [Woeseiaceae bacterium]|nr:CDP-alcohol phosphatidyltransferase family protein [Woeseiaceae bacterium]